MDEISEKPNPQPPRRRRSYTAEPIGLVAALKAVEFVLLGLDVRSDQVRGAKDVLRFVLTTMYKLLLKVDLEELRDDETPPGGISFTVQATEGESVCVLRFEVHDLNSRMPDRANVNVEPGARLFVDRFDVEATESGTRVWAEINLRAGN